MWLWMRSKLPNGIVVFDRYWHEFVLQTRYRQCPKILLGMVEKLAPQPDALVFLDVAPQVAYDRKREQPLSEIQRVHGLCGQLIANAPHGYSIPAAELQ